MSHDALSTELGILGERAAEHVGDALSRFLHVQVKLHVREVGFAPLNDVPGKVAAPEALAVGLLSRVEGNVEGNALLLVEVTDAARLVSLLGGAVKDNAFGDMERSMLEETANIALSSFMNCLSGYFKRSCVPSSPIFLMDLAGAILSVVLTESAGVSDEAFLFCMEFTCENRALAMELAFLPSPDALGRIREGLAGA